jgi:hypothetical protein
MSKFLEGLREEMLSESGKQIGRVPVTTLEANTSKERLYAVPWPAFAIPNVSVQQLLSKF